MIKKKCTWIAVIDFGKATFLTKDSEGHLYVIENKLAVTSRSEGRGDMGRVHDRIGPGRHITEPKTGEKTLDERNFIDEVATYMEDALADNKFQRLIIVAPSKPLGQLRKLLSKPLKDVIALELEKDYVNTPIKELQQRLEDHIFI